MINKLRYAVGGLIVLLAMAGLLRLRSCVKASMPQASKPHAVLPRDVKEQVSINSEKHTVTVTTQTGSKTEFAKDPIISVNKTGDVSVSRGVYGAEHLPSLGIGYGGDARLYLGASVYYVYELELNTQLAFALSPHAPAFVEPVLSVGYNFYGNTSVFIGVNPTHWFLGLPAQVHAGLMVKF